MSWKGCRFESCTGRGIVIWRHQLKNRIPAPSVCSLVGVAHWGIHNQMKIEEKVKDWEGVHEAFGKMRMTTGKEMEQWVRKYHDRARAYEAKHSEYMNPLQKPR